ncbi:MAG: thermonuclease family protein [Devosia sp.]|nr:thermonuclease family protein [Devosia sp.]
MRPLLLMLSLALLLPGPAAAQLVQLEMCAPGQRNTADKTCIVDGDTLWLHGENIRLKDFDTPEPQTNICGGEAEKALAARASARLLELLNGNAWTIERYGLERGGRGRRALATIRIDGRDVGDILIKEGLARRWPDGDEWWCRL